MGQCDIPPVPTNAIFSGTASHAFLIASPNAHTLFKGVKGGPWQLIFIGIGFDLTSHESLDVIMTSNLGVAKLKHGLNC